MKRFDVPRGEEEILWHTLT